jgi:hypothetical protein
LLECRKVCVNLTVSQKWIGNRVHFVRSRCDGVPCEAIWRPAEQRYRDFISAGCGQSLTDRRKLAGYRAQRVAFYFPKNQYSCHGGDSN